MRIIDKNGRVFGKVNIIDFVLILLAVLAVFAVSVNKFMPNRAIKNIRRMPQQEDCIVKVILDKERVFLVKDIKVGDGQRDIENNFVAQITGIRKEEIPDSPDAYVVSVSIKATVDNSGFFIYGKSILRPGEVFSFETKDYLLRGIIFKVLQQEK
ncbi:MAG: DUF4330 domain-containing protein [Candidatus Omnitrophica bacterium]|nr:DUF4330 domain-containing protein [Candidatus Omnitrophota bacterium]MBU1868997.1 DUF4330 domain-containing protein [Candidatus Omnitrophota bacterium]